MVSPWGELPGPLTPAFLSPRRHLLCPLQSGLEPTAAPRRKGKKGKGKGKRKGKGKKRRNKELLERHEASVPSVVASQVESVTNPPLRLLNPPRLTQLR